MKDAFTIFIAPPSFEELERRLVGRGTEDDAQRRRRLTTAEAELTSEHQWDARIVNDDVALAGQSIVDLVKSSHDAAAFKE
jgi:guanylate kinase